MIDSMELKMKLTFKEYIEIERRIIINRLFSLRSNDNFMLKLVYIFAFLIPVFVGIRIITGRDDLVGFFLIALSIDVLFVCIDILDKYIYGKKFIKHHSIYKIERRNIIGRDGIAEFYKGGKLFSEWDEYSIMYESKNVYKLYMTNGQYAYISKSAFNTQKELDFFNECTANIKRG